VIGPVALVKGVRFCLFVFPYEKIVFSLAVNYDKSELISKIKYPR